jgi:PE family
MSLLSVAPDIVAEAGAQLENLGSTLRSATAAAASQTTAVAAPAADQVSMAVAALLGTHGQEFQTINAQAAEFHDEFVSRLGGGAAQYAGAELTNAQQMLANAASAQGIAVSPLNVNQNYGPFGVALKTTIDSGGPSGLLGTTNASVVLNTPFGPAPLLAASGITSIASNGQFRISLGQNAPFASFGASMTGELLPEPTVTGLAFSIDGLTVSLAGTGLGGLPLPNVSYSLLH